MRKLIFAIAAAAVICGCSNTEQEEPKISIFTQHIESIAKQQNISFAQAAELVKEIGYTGVDIQNNIPESEIKTLDSLGFKHASAISYVYFTDGEQEEDAQATIDWMKQHQFDRVLLVPGFYKEGFTPEDEALTASRLGAFADRAAAENLWILAEDYDNWLSPCLNIERLSGLFNASDNLGHVLDTGNFFFSGDDVLVALEKFHSKIGHVHLKDRVSAENLSCPPVGTGCLPIKEIITDLVTTGYDGWFTVEQFGSRNMLEDSKVSYANVKAAIEEAQTLKK